MKNPIEEGAIRNYNKLLSMKIYVSYKEYLEGCYEEASKRKQYNLCAAIQDLIIKDINGDRDLETSEPDYEQHSDADPGL